MLFSKNLLQLMSVISLIVMPQPLFADELSGRLPAAISQSIDSAAERVLGSTGVPGISVAIVEGGEVVLTRAYGAARLDPEVPADPEQRFPIGSITKQFTAAALLLLQEQGKLSLDDRVSKYLPDLTGAELITIRQLLSHTSGYQDYWPQDYVPASMLRAIDSRDILDEWARKPLDYEPGSKWQYSNTGYIVAGLIAERVSGQPLFEFMQQRIFEPLKMRSVRNVDTAEPDAGAASGYRRFALGPARPAPATGDGWLFAAGDLAMTASDLALWDISIINRSLLSAASYDELETATRLSNGVGAGYGLGIKVDMNGLHRRLSHGGEISGFTAFNAVYPDERKAYVILVNQDAAQAIDKLADSLDELLLEEADTGDNPQKTQALNIFSGLQQGRIERGLFTDNANFYFSEEALADFKDGLAPLGKPTGFVETRHWLRGGMTGRSYDATFAGKTLRIWTYAMPDGRLEQYQIAASE